MRTERVAPDVPLFRDVAMTPAIPTPPLSHRVSPLGLCLAALFFGASLTPSLLPRDPVMQGVLGGLVAGIGHEVGVAMAWGWRFLGIPVLSSTRHLLLTALAGLFALVVSIWCLWHAADWQNATRVVMHLPPVDTSHPRIIAPVAFGVFAATWVLVRLFGAVQRRLTALLNHVLPPRVGFAIGVALALFLFWSLINGVLVKRAFEIADASFEAADELIEPDIPRPTEPGKTGGPDSLVDWEEMGRWGRAFVATAPTREEIAAFKPDIAMDPIRVYVGRRAAETAQERAEVALQELIRQGGFSRKALVVMVPVGTGWMDPGGQDTLDFMLGGDVATVAVQYSYLTSVLSILANPDYGVEQARVLHDVVYDYWTELDPATRPRLYVHGLSQGALNSQSSLPILDMLGDPVSGALWAGSPFISPLWQFMRDQRQPDSPAWQPRFGNGSLAQVTNQSGEFDLQATRWGPIRLVFLHYGSDPIVAFSFTSAFRRPDWMRDPRAPDVPPEFRWFPVVTMFQLALDMAISLQVEGFGHYYIAADYIDAWAEVLEPEGWTPQRAAELKDIFLRRGPAF